MILMFEEYLKEIIENADKTFYNYQGINRKTFPKWDGWKIINSYKEEGVHPKNIENEKLDTLVKNHYYLKYIKEHF